VQPLVQPLSGPHFVGNEVAFAIDAYESRNAHGNIGPLKSLNASLEVSVRHGRPCTQSDVLGPGRNDESLNKEPVFPQVAKDAPADGSISTPHRLDGMDSAEKFFAMLGIDPVFDLNQNRTIFGPGLEDNGQFRQLRPRSDIGLVAHCHACAASDR
jgi:hypothetical protein